ncbi:MAG: hypothetical protein KDB10_23310, partial [Acidimicrobiales bacterium]|nr:hypothetical protein [Acidimicrobiales bacterium]
ETGDEATADGPGDVAGPTLRLEDQTTWVEPGGTYVLRVRVEGDVPAGAQVEATVHEATESRSDFREQVGGLSLGEVVGDPGRAAAPTGARAVAALRFATGEPVPGAASAPLDGAGVHPVEVRLVAEGAVLDRVVTHLVRLPDEASEAPPLRVAAVVPVDRGIAIAPNGRRRATPVGDERLDTLLEALLERPEVALTVVPTPETLVSLDGTPALTRLRRAADGRQVVSSQYVSLDLAAWVAAGLDDDLARQTTAGEAALAELLVDRPDRRTAVAGATLTPEALTRLEELGADQVVVPADALAPVDPAAFPTTLAQPFSVLDSTGQTARAVAADAGLAAHPGETGDPVLDAANLLADLAVVWFDRPSETRGVTFTLPRVWEPSPRFLDTLLSGLAESRLLAPVTLDQLFARVPPATVGGAADPDGPPLVRTLAPRPAPSLGQYPQALPLTRLTTEGFTSFAGADNPVVESMRRRLLVSGSQDFDRTQRRAYLEAISRQIDRAAAAVVAPESGNVTLTSRDGRIPLNISNENLYDVTVKIRFDSDKLTFPDGDTVIVHLPRSTVTPLDVDVRSRSSGSFPLRVVISSPDDIVLVSRSQFTVRSTAVSGVGIVLSVGAGLFLALWWASHFRRVRRARRLVAADEAAAAVAAGDEAAPPG